MRHRNVQILSRVSFQKKATNVSYLRHPTSIQPSSNINPAIIQPLSPAGSPFHPKNGSRFFSAKSKKPLRLRGWSWSNVASRGIHLFRHGNGCKRLVDFPNGHFSGKINMENQNHVVISFTWKTLRIHGVNYLQKIANLLRICPQTSWNTNNP